MSPARPGPANATNTAACAGCDTRPQPAAEAPRGNRRRRRAGVQEINDVAALSDGVRAPNAVRHAAAGVAAEHCRRLGASEPQPATRTRAPCRFLRSRPSWWPASRRSIPLWRRSTWRATVRAARGADARRCTPLRAALARFEHRRARCGRFARASDARARATASYTELQSLEHLAPLSGSLTALDASDNALRCAAGVASLPLLTEADLRHNALDDLAALVTALRPLRRLRALALAGNPLCSAFSSAHAYRAAVAAALPQLRDLDGVALPRSDAAAQGERAGAAEDGEEEHGAPRDAEPWRQWRMPRGPRAASPQRARGASSPEPTGGDEAGWARDEAAADEREAAHSAAVATALLRAQLAAARREAQENAARAEAAEAAAATAEEVTARTEAALQVRPSCALAMTCRAHAARHRAERARCSVGCRCASCRRGGCSG